MLKKRRECKKGGQWRIPHKVYHLMRVVMEKLMPKGTVFLLMDLGLRVVLRALNCSILYEPHTDQLFK